MFTPAPSSPPRPVRAFARGWAPAFGYLLGRSPNTGRAGLLNGAEVVAWQASRRLAAATLLGAISLGLRLAGVVAGPIWPVLVVVPAYIVVVAALTLVIERRRSVTRVGLAALSLADVAAIFGIAALASAPAFYPRALFLSLLALQFAQLFFGRTPAITTLVASVAGYAALLATAWFRGVGIGWWEQGWLVALFVVVSLNGIAMQASANRRLAALVDLFASAQRGDLARTFIDEPGRVPDGITILGRTYNHLRAELASMVHTDPLTGCLNRRGFEQSLAHAAGTAARRGGDLSLLAIDIDHFKMINDTAGHLAGDAVLRELVELISRSSRGGDVVARVGGEEFVVLLPETDLETAGVVAERVAGLVRDHVFRAIRGRRRVTVSIGVASERMTDAAMAGALRARADEALYVAKRLGRNRVVLWAPGTRSNATPPWTDVERLIGNG